MGSQISQLETFSPDPIIWTVVILATCSVANCRTKSTDDPNDAKFAMVPKCVGLRLFTLPTNANQEVINKWKWATGRPLTNLPQGILRFCSLHFSITQYNQGIVERLINSNTKATNTCRLLRVGAVPDIVPSTKNVKIAFGRAQRVVDRNSKKVQNLANASQKSSQIPDKGNETSGGVTISELDEEEAESMVQAENRADVSDAFAEESMHSVDVTDEPTACETSTDSAFSDYDASSSSVPTDNSRNQLDVEEGASVSYGWLVKKVYAAGNVPSYAEKTVGFTSNYSTEAVSKKFLQDAVSKLNDTSKETDGYKKKLANEIKKNEKLQRQLEKEKESYTKKEDELLKLKEALQTRFTPAQLSRIVDGKRANWGESDFSHAVTLLGMKSQSYDYIRLKMNYPMPAASTVYDYLRRIVVSPGLIKPILNLMSYASPRLTEKQRLTVLSIDETGTKNRMCHDSTKDQVIGPHKLMQTAYARSLTGDWENAVYFNFSSPITQENYEEILAALYKSSFEVVAIVTDLGFDNLSFFRKHKVDHTKPHLPHPSTGKNVYVFPDAPHVFKLGRNHLLDWKILLNPDDAKSSWKVACRAPLDELVSLTGFSDLRQHEVELNHLHVQGSERQNVEKAARLLSHCTAEALLRNGIDGSLKANNYEATSFYCKMMRKYFDLFNVKRDERSDCQDQLYLAPEQLPYGGKLDEQNALLEAIHTFANNLRVLNADGTQKKPMAWQLAVMQSVRALQGLHEDLQLRFQEEPFFICTINLNQDCLERYFGLLRTLFGSNTNPDPVQCIRRVKRLAVGHTKNLNKKGCNVSIEEALEEQGISFLSVMALKHLREISGEETVDEEEGEADDDDDDDDDDDEEEISDEECETPSQIPIDWSPPDSTKEEYKRGLMALAERIAGQLGTKKPALVGDKRADLKGLPDWLSKRYRKNTAPASAFLKEMCEKMDVVFREFHKNHIDRGEKVNQRFVESVLKKYSYIEPEVAKSFAQKRLWMRMRTINEDVWSSRKRKNRKQSANEMDKDSRQAKKLRLYQK